jgi:hypothetical protein
MRSETGQVLTREQHNGQPVNTFSAVSMIVTDVFAGSAGEAQLCKTLVRQGPTSSQDNLHP